MEEFKHVDEVQKYWQDRGGSTIRKKGNYQSKKDLKKFIYMKHGPEYVPAILHTISIYSPNLFIELGTFAGGMTLAIHEEFPDLEIHTFDISDNVGTNRFLFSGKVHFRNENILGAENSQLVLLLTQTSGKIMLYCDNGNKEFEINTYANFLKLGDIIGCHDWLFEVNPKNVEFALRDFEPFDRETYLNENWAIHTRFWVKRR